MDGCNPSLMRPTSLSAAEKQTLWWKELNSSVLIVDIM